MKPSKRIPGTNLKHGFEKKERKAKANEILKEDRQAFGALEGSVANIDEAFECPHASIPLSISTNGKSPKKSNRAEIKNLLMMSANAIKTRGPKVTM